MTITMNIKDFKAKFTKAMELVENGMVIKVINGKTGELVGYFSKDIKLEMPPKRKLGFFNDLGVTINKEDVQWSREELTKMGF
jgi:hypothetical protein